MESVTRTARQRAREEISTEILRAGRAALAESGPGELSLRAVARSVGMVSSAVYRYFPSRDDLLTALIVIAYDELGTAAEAAADGVTDRSDAGARWLATCRAVRSWALAHPHDYALLYGSPVRGYAAPDTTVVPAMRVVRCLVDAVVAERATGSADPMAPAGAPAGFDTSVSGAVGAMPELFGLDAALPAELVGRTLMAWSTVFGTISFELWGHLVGSITDHDVYFDGVVTRLWHDLGGR